jgi:hypothetical protein
MNNYIVAILTVLCFASCKKDKKEAALDPVPVIELISITPTNVTQFKDSILVTIKYTDNNGDIGDTNPDEYSLYVKDSRLVKADGYHIQPLAPVGNELVFSGQLNIKINTLFLLGNGTQELANLSIKLKDRAGNWSNELISPSITINK